MIFLKNLYFLLKGILMLKSQNMPPSRQQAFYYFVLKGILMLKSQNMPPSRQQAFYYFACLPRREHIKVISATVFSYQRKSR